MQTTTDSPKTMPDPSVGSGDLFAGLWVAEDAAGHRLTIEVYDHPERGLCVWYDDYAPGNSTLYCESGHIPVNASELKFLSLANTRC